MHVVLVDKCTVLNLIFCFKNSSKLLRLRHEIERDRHRACWTLSLVVRRWKTEDDIFRRFRYKREWRFLRAFFIKSLEIVQKNGIRPLLLQIGRRVSQARAGSRLFWYRFENRGNASYSEKIFDESLRSTSPFFITWEWINCQAARKFRTLRSRKPAKKVNF